MNYRRLGKTNLMVSEIGLGGEWFERHTYEECKAIIDHCEEKGINILDCWMSNPVVRSVIGDAIKGKREKWFVQGHIGSTWENGQYIKTRDVEKAKIAFEDMLTRFHTDYIDLGMIHYVDQEDDFEEIINGPFIEYVRELKEKRIIHHIGMSTHNPAIAKKAVKMGLVEMIMFSINPAFDMLPVIDDIDKYFEDEYDESLGGISKERSELYKLCENNDVGITVMKGYAGGRLFNEKASPFKVKLTPVMCLHYALTRPAVKSVMVGFDTVNQVDEAVYYEKATSDEKDYATVLASALKHSYGGECTYCGHCKPCPKDIDIAMVNKLYDLAIMQEETPESIKSHYHELKVNANDCIHCKSCEKRCPFHVKISEKMEKAAKLFK